MRRLLASFTLLVVGLFLLTAASARADISPYSAHGSSTDFCTKCHDVHEAEGDYALTRAATVTALCTTCHGLFGNPPPPYPQWSADPPTDFSGTDPTASVLTAYDVNMNGMTPEQMDAVPGHSLGVMLEGAIARYGNSITGSTFTLKVMISGIYDGHSLKLFNGNPVTNFYGTEGLYCASCHTVHDVLGQIIPNTELLSSRPNHNLTDPPAADETGFCLRCHDKRYGPDSERTTTETGPDGTTHTVGVDDQGNLLHNHPSQFCLDCHGNEKDANGNPVGVQDFPHTSTFNKLLTREPDALCLSCHVAGNLP